MALQTTADRIRAYLQLREHKQLSEQAFKKSMERVNEAMAKLEGELLNDLNLAGTDSVAVKDIGTAYRVTRESASVQDRDAFLEFIREKSAWEVLDARVSKQAAKEYMDSTGEPVPGIRFSSDSTIGIRKK